MSLPTPPGTSHRGEKENKRPGTSRVAWAEHPEYHSLADSPQRLTVFTASSAIPTRSILKKPKFDALPCFEPETRESTPEPSDPLVNLHYLDNPVSRLLAADAAMRDVIESYNVLMARLRVCLVDDANTDASWPLFQPLRKNRDVLVEAICRDLGRALEEPVGGEDEEEEIRALPSPEKSPKKRGMTAEQAKHARDLCTTAHSVMKFLSLVLTMPCLFNIFDESHLSDILTGVLAIPLAPKLPTPNARKTCALAISLLQMQRLPEGVLEPARDRIAYALRRGIDGELGKEGKKGSCNDGLRAIHDLSIHYPAVFVPAFAEIIPSVFAQLLAPTLVLRLQASHALGGFSFGLASLPVQAIHSQVASDVAYWLTKAPLGTPTKKPSSPSKDPLIIRTLRTTLGATDPKHVAQGPVWGLSVLASLITMLGSQLYVDERMTKTLTPLLSFAMRHPKSSVRALVCLVWRVMSWAYFQPVCPKLSDIDEESEEDQERVVVPYSAAERKHHAARLEECWKVVGTVLDMGAGVSTLCVLLGTPASSATRAEWAIKKALAIVEEMIAKGGSTCKEAVDALATLVSPHSGTQQSNVFDVPEALDDDSEWNPMKLLPLGLFSANPGLLTAEYAALPSAVRPLFADCPHIEDLRALTKDELTIDWVFDKIIDIWKDGFASLTCSWDGPLPSEMLDVWSGLWAAAVSVVKDDLDSERLLSSLAHRATNLIIIILRNDKLDLSGRAGSDDGDFLPVSGATTGLPKSRWKPALKLRLVRELWRRLRDTFQAGDVLATQAARLLVVLERKEPELVVRPELPDAVRGEWALLCAEVLGCCEDEQMLAYWGLSHKPRRRATPWADGVRCVVWRQWVQKWADEEASWESSVVLLAAPFLDANAWDMSNEDLDTWDRFLRQTIDRALDSGHDSVDVVDSIARLVAPHGSLSLLSSTRISDLLLSHLDISEARLVPSALCELVNDTLDTAYPPTPQNKLPSIWLLRTLSRTLDACPIELVEHLLECVQDGLARWIADEARTLSEKEYSLDIVPLYQTATVVLMSVTAKADVVERFAGLLHAGFAGRGKPETLAQAFVDLWESTYKSITPPSHGWSENITTCLRLSGLVVADEADVESNDADEVEGHLLELPPSSDDVPFSPEVPSPTSLAAPFSLFSPVRKPRELTFPSTPTTIKKCPVTPPRPHKTSSPVRPMAPLLLFESPVRSPTRSPVTPKKRTPGVRGPDKENASPLRLIPSVAERIAGRSPMGSVAPVLGKRAFDLEEDEEYIAEGSKRPKNDVPMGPSNSPAKFDARAPVLQAFVTASQLSPTRPPASKRMIDEPKTPSNLKRRRSMVLDAVEVPTLREVMRKAVSFDVAATTALDGTPKQSGPRRTQSAARPSERRGRTPSPFKKRKVAPLPDRSRARPDDDDDDDEWNPSSLSSPLRQLRAMAEIGSDDSIMLEPSVRMDSDIPSSDDDPSRFLGVVTPHRLVSPAVRRLKDFDDFDEPGSDDSNICASPTTDRVARMSVEKSKRGMNASPFTPSRSPLALLGSAR